MWCEAITTFLTDFTFLYAQWSFVLMYYRISARLKDRVPAKEARDSGMIARESLDSTSNRAKLMKPQN